ncbi:MAG: peptidylprolyl isomerase [Gammaproteobacteria bacterium]|nr:peptidylprolyl isomerase [Gammaproteobacteria bacterium]
MKYSRLLCFATLAALAACQPRSATVPGDNSPPVATVNGAPITRDFYEFYIKGLSGGKTSADLTAQQRTLVLDNMIRAKLIEQQAAKDGLDRTGEAPFLLEAARWNVLQQISSDHYLKDRKPTEQELRAEYETSLQSMPKTEFHARNILVATEPFAQKIIDRLDKGEKFDVIAKAESMDPSKSNGGDLGWFTPDRMPPELSGAVLALKPGEYTHKPVHTQYGWHVIQLLETRDLTPPPYEQVKPRLTQMVQAKKFRGYADELMQNAKIEKFLDQPKGGAATAPPAPAASAPSVPPAAAPTAPAPAPAPASAPASKPNG